MPQPTLGQLAGSPIPLEIGGRTYRLSQPTLADVGEFRTWVAQEPFRRINAVLETLAPPLQAAMIEKAYAESRELAREENVVPAMERAVNTPEGGAYLMWLMLHSNHPELSLADVSKLIDQANALMLQRKLAEAAGLDPTTGPLSPAAGAGQAITPAG